MYLDDLATMCVVIAYVRTRRLHVSVSRSATGTFTRPRVALTHQSQVRTLCA